MPSCVIAGGGAAGFFAAITCAEANPSVFVTLCEALPKPLSKVRISGGGRCNVTHACFDPRELIKGYPRGGRELLGPFHQWQSRDTVGLFEERGVPLKTEADRRMFPVTDDSATVIDCLLEAAKNAGVWLRTSAGVKAAERAGTGYRVRLASGETLDADRLLLATGGGRSSAGLAIAESLGHTLTPLVPSLFTFHIDDPRIKGLEGLSVPDAAVTLRGSRLVQQGPMLITHWGLSGPAILKLSAWGARELAACGYAFTLGINWLGGARAEAVHAALTAARTAHAKRQIATWNPLGLPARLWERLVEAAGIAPQTVWTSVANAALQQLARQVTAGEFTVTGKSVNKEEFVTCGGVRLEEVDFRTMESRRSPGLFLAGEVLDIDGVTGGFNLQSAWTTGRLAGLALARA